MVVVGRRPDMVTVRHPSALSIIPSSIGSPQQRDLCDDRSELVNDASPGTPKIGFRHPGQAPSHDSMGDGSRIATLPNGESPTHFENPLHPFVSDPRTRRRANPGGSPMAQRRAAHSVVSTPVRTTTPATTSRVPPSSAATTTRSVGATSAATRTSSGRTTMSSAATAVPSPEATTETDIESHDSVGSDVLSTTTSASTPDRLQRAGAPRSQLRPSATARAGLAPLASRRGGAHDDALRRLQTRGSHHGC
jgi:hypothetical protein